MNLNHLQFWLFEFRANLLLKRYVARRTSRNLRKLTKFLTPSLESAENNEFRRTRNTVILFNGWVSKSSNIEISRKQLELLNPGFRVHVRRFPRRELIRHARHFGFSPGFKVVAELRQDQHEVKLEDFLLAGVLPGGKLAHIVPSNSGARFMISKLNSSKTNLNVAESASEAYVDRVIFQDIELEMSKQSWFNIYFQRNIELTFSFLDTKSAASFLPQVISALAGFPAYARLSDRVKLIAHGIEGDFDSDLEVFEIIRKLEPTLRTGATNYPKMEFSDGVVKALPGSKPIPNIPSDWLTLQDVQLHRASVITSRNKLYNYEHAADPKWGFISGLWRHVYGSTMNHSAALLELDPSADVAEKEVVLIGGRNDSNWYHFVIEYLPRVLKIPEEIHKSVPIVVSTLVPESAKQLLESLTSRRIVYLDPDFRYAFDTIHVSAPVMQILDTTSVPWDEGVFMRKDALTELRKAGIRLSSGQVDSPRKVFLARRSAHRGLLNQSKLSQIAEELGLTIVDPMQLSPFEQIHLFAHADLVVGAGGAVMANYIFMKPGSRVLALTSNSLRGFVLPAVLANFASASFTYVCGKPKLRILNFSPSESNMHADFRVNESIFRKQLIEELASVN